MAGRNGNLEMAGDCHAGGGKDLAGTEMDSKGTEEGRLWHWPGLSKPQKLRAN